jgi:cytochrome c oxidase cbb3-type subunit I
MHPFYVIRAIGGFLFLLGALVMAWNLWKTVTAAKEVKPADLALAPAE